jgi:hypothetical protein
MTPEGLRQELHYNPETGEFKRRKSGGGVLAGARAGGLDAYGHRTISVMGTRYRSARLAVFYMTGAWPKDDVDHINGDRDDDRWENLRLATRSQNLANMRARGKSGVKGACWVEAKGRWKSQIRVDGKNRHLGYFDTVEDAANAYRDAALRHHGEFARWG